jgi:SnoaL-like polyketide cyclase
VGRWFTEFWGKDFNPAIIDELTAPDIRFEYSLHAPLRGRDAVRAFAGKFRAAFPDLNFWGTADLIAEGDYVVGQWEGGGTHTGDAFDDMPFGPLPLPCLVAVGAADGAGTVAGGDGGLLVGEEDAVPHVSAAGDRAQRRRAVETAVDPDAPVAAPLPSHVRPIGPAVGTQQDVVHGASWRTSP